MTRRRFARRRALIGMRVSLDSGTVYGCVMAEVIGLGWR